MDKELVISVKTIVIVAGIAFASFIIVRMGQIFGILGIALLISIATEQFVKFLVRKQIRRGVAVYFTYILLILVIVGLFTVGIPPLLNELRKLVANLPSIAQGLSGLERYGLSITDLVPQITQASTNVVAISYSIFSNVAIIITIFFLALYISLDWENIKTRFLSLFTVQVRDEIEETVFEIEVSVSQWVKGQALLMLVVGLAMLVGLYGIGVEYALALAVIGGLLEFVPMIGPVISTVIVTAITFTQSPVKGFIALGICIIVQQLENNLLVPRIMQKVSGFSPLVILIAVITFTHFFGLVGTIVAVPCVMVGYVIVKRFLNYAGSE